MLSDTGCCRVQRTNIVTKGSEAICGCTICTANILVFIGDGNQLRCQLAAKNGCWLNDDDGCSIGCCGFRCCNTAKAPAKDKDITDIVVSIRGSLRYVDKAAPFDVEDTGEFIRGRRRCNVHI